METRHTESNGARNAAMARVLVADVDVNALLDAAEGPVTVRLDLSGCQQEQVVESMARWLCAEIKHHGPATSSSVAPKRFVIARFCKVVRLRKGAPPRAFYVRAA